MQADSIRELLMSGNLNNTQQVMLTRLLGTLAERQGMCERIKYTPFPRQIASFAAIFTWIFVLLLPLAFIDVFEAAATRERLSHMLTDDIAFILLAPLAAVISWVFCNCPGWATAGFGEKILSTEETGSDSSIG